MNKFHGVVLVLTGLLLVGCGGDDPPDDEGANVTEKTQKQKALELQKSIETGDPGPLEYLGAYTQHNLAVPDGRAGLEAVLAQLPEGSAKVNTVRAFEDGDFVFTHTDYNFFGPKIGFDVFRFEGGKIAEHWDNLQETPTSPNPSQRTMIDGRARAASAARPRHITTSSECRAERSRSTGTSSRRSRPRTSGRTRTANSEAGRGSRG
jgi:predicted SnoaL-like aldol condensation-catalyzing enzyme